MNVLIVNSKPDLAQLWARHVMRQGADVACVETEMSAVQFLQKRTFDIIVLDLMLDGGSAFAVADYASYRQPDARVVFVTSSHFFSDGSIFRHIPNACAFLPSGTPPEDLAAVVGHYGELGAVATPEPN
ncbi:MAG: response regulator [Pseudomonadota bacterium]